jgi:hypothetical protein
VSNGVGSPATSTAVTLTVSTAAAGTQTNYSGGSYTQNFDTLPSTGSFTLSGTGAVIVPLSVAAPTGVGATGVAGWTMSKYAGTGTATAPLFTVNNGSSTSGSVFSYGATSASDRALGSLGSGSTISRFGLSLVNTTSSTITQFTLSYTGEQWRRGSAAANVLTFGYLVGASDINTGTFNSAAALNFTAPITTGSGVTLDGNLAANRTAISSTVTGLSWAPGQVLVLRWTDVDDSGSDDGLAIDDLTFTTPVAAAPFAPAVTSTTPANSATQVAGNAPITVTFNQAVTLSGSWFTINSALTGAIAATVTSSDQTTFTLTPPANFSDNDTVTVTIVAAQITDTASGTLHPSGNTTFSFTTAAPIAPSIATQPTVQTASAGATATFTVVASGTAPLSYQWRKSGTPISGNASATTATLTLTNVQSTDAANYDVVVSNGVNPSATSTAVALTVNPAAPTITTQPLAQTLSVGGTATFTVVASGTTPLSYQWRKGGVAISSSNASATTATLTLTNVQTTDAANYDVVVTNGVNPAATSSAVALTVSTATLNNIVWDFTTADPTSGLPSGVTGGTVTQGNNNGTTTLLTTTSVSSGYTGATGTNNAGAAARIGALNQAASGSAYFEFTLTPAAGKRLVASAIAFGMRSTSTGPQAYALYSSADGYAAPIATGTLANDSVWRLISPTMTTVTSATATALTFRLFGYNGAGSPSASTANWRMDDLQLTVSTLTSPAITTQPTAQSSGAGGGATFNVVATGTPAPTYQWRKNGSAIAGATGATLTLSNIFTDAAGNYDVVVTNSAGSVTSSTAALSVGRSGATITITNLSQVYNGSPRSAAVSVAPFVPPSAITVTYSGSSNPPTAAGSYAVAVSVNDTNFVGTAGGTLVIAKAAQTVSFGTLPAAPLVGVPFTVSATATGSLTPIAFSVVSGNATVSGASVTLNDTSPVTLRATQAGDANTAAATADATLTAAKQDQLITFAAPADRLTTAAPLPLSATASSGLAVSFSIVSGPATLTGGTLTLNGTTGIVIVRAAQAGSAAFNAAPSVDRSFAVTAPLSAPIITAQPAPVVALVGGSASFSVSATGNPSPTYQWRKNGNAIAGATGAAFPLANVQSADAASYDVVVTNSVGSVTSSLAPLTVATTTTAPVITRQPAGLTLAVGRAATFTVVATGVPAPAYQWTKNGSPIAGATGASLSFGAVSTDLAGGYAVVVTNSAGSVTSSTATLTVLRRSFAGSYFGALSNGGTFAIFIRDDNTGVFLGFAPGSRTAYVSRGITVDDNGHFSFTTTITTSGSSAAGAATNEASGHLTAAATTDLVFEGTISSDGTLSAAATTGASLSFSATKTADGGAASSVAGFYQAGSAGSSAETLAIISPAGQVFVVTQTGTTVDAGNGTVDATGKVTVTTAAQQTIAVTVSADTSGVTASVTDAKGATTNFSGFAANSTALAAQRIMNLSSRAFAGTAGQVAIAGFVISGVESKSVLIRAVGPTLAGFGLTTALAAPKLDLLRGSTTLASNTGWTTSGNTAAIAAAASRAGAFALGAASADSVILTTLAPGSYTAIVSAADAKPGVGLIEVYDLSGASLDQRLINISTLATAGPGDSTLIAGVIISGSAPKRVLVRAAGPALTQFGIANALARPQLTLYSGNAIIAQNSGWSTSADGAAIADAASRVGAFAFGPASADAAVILNLAPGAYTAQVATVGAATGVALVEIYELP